MKSQERQQAINYVYLLKLDIKLEFGHQII